MGLNIFTWNATGLMSSCSYLCDVLNNKQIDICGISEHWLCEKDILFLDSIDNQYSWYATYDHDLSIVSQRKVGKGGVCLLWNKRLSNVISPVPIDDDRIIGLQINLGMHNLIFVFQVYLPCSNHSINSYKGYIDKIENILSTYYQKGVVIVMGDINSELSLSRTRGKYLCSMLERFNYISVNTLDMCTGSKHTNVSYNGRIETMIDHVLIPVEKLDLICSCEILDDDSLNVSSHRPILCNFVLPNCDQSFYYSQNEHGVNWRKISLSHKERYCEYLSKDKNILSFLDYEVKNKTDVDFMYQGMTSSICQANNCCFPKSKFRHYLKPYWDNDLKMANNISKTKRWSWVMLGKPQSGPAYIEYKNAKKHFRYLHRKKVNQFLVKTHEEIDKYAEIDSAYFWKLVNNRRKMSNTACGGEMIFNGSTYRDLRLSTTNGAIILKTYTHLQ